MFDLTAEQIAEIASAKSGPELTKAVQKICCVASLAFPILRIIDEELAGGARIEMREHADKDSLPVDYEKETKVCLIGADGDVIARGSGLKELFIECIFVLC